MFSSIFNMKMATQKFIILVVLFKMHAVMTAITMQAKKIVSSEVQDN